MGASPLPRAPIRESGSPRPSSSPAAACGRSAGCARPPRRVQGEGRIVNVSSIYGITTTPLSGWYQACKHGLEAVSDALRVEVARDGIKVILVQPGSFDTGIWEDSRRSVRRRIGTRYATAYERTLDGVRLSRP